MARKSAHSLGKPGRPRVDAVPILVRVPPAELRHLDQWIAQRPEPRPSRPEALRILARLAQLPGAKRASTELPRPSGLPLPGFLCHWSGGQWVVAWQPQHKIAKRGCPMKRIRLWSGAEPSAADWRRISDECVRYDRQMRDWDLANAASRAEHWMLSR